MPRGDRTGTYHGRMFYFKVEWAQAFCARCGKRSPAVAFRQYDAKDVGARKNVVQITEGLEQHGWDITNNKAYCPTCRRIGRERP